MRQLGLFATAFLVLCLAACSGKKEDKKDDKDSGKGKTNEEKLIGTWEAAKPSKDLPPGATLEFTKDGKLIMEAKVKIPAKDKEKEKEMPVRMEGTYKVDGDKITSVLK